VEALLHQRVEAAIGSSRFSAQLLDRPGGRLADRDLQHDAARARSPGRRPADHPQQAVDQALLLGAPELDPRRRAGRQI
jgi:hypothetical protein